MDIFLDTASIDDIKKYAWCVDGVTTNPSLVSRENLDVVSSLKAISSVIEKPVHVEVLSVNEDGMVSEGKWYFSIAQNVVIKVPATKDGFCACKKLSDLGIPTNVTLCFSCSQAILAAKCNATYVSPFIGRLDDSGENGLATISNIVEIYTKQKFQTVVLAASIRSISHVVECSKIGVNAVTIPPRILGEMINHDLTNKGFELFRKDYSKK